MPGTYTVRLTAGPHEPVTQTITVRMDPRIRATALAVGRQHTAALRVVDAMKRDSAALHDARELRPRVTGAQSDSLTAVTRDLTRLNGQLAGLLGVIDGYDDAPTTQAMRAIGELERALRVALARLDAAR